MTKPQETVQQIQLADILVATANPRGPINTKSEKFVQMVAGAKVHGILEPCLGRPHPKKKGKIELWAGERRLEAARAAGLKTLPMLVREMSDQEAVEVRAVENMDREDLTPLQEAESIAQLMEAYQGSAEETAARLGKDRAWVNRRARLVNLSPAWKELVGREYFETSVAHMELVAGFPLEQQDSLVPPGMLWLLEPGRYVQFRRYVAERTYSLGAAPWKLSDDTLTPAAGACSACPKRSGCVADMFEDQDTKAKKTDLCLDHVCYGAKLAAHLARRRDELRAEHSDLVLVEGEDGHGMSHSDGVLHPHQYEVVKKATPGARPALVECGKGAGKVIYVKPSVEPDDDLDGHGGAGPADQKPSGEMSLAEKRSKLERRRWALVIGEVRECLGAPGDGPAPAEYQDAEGMLRLAAVFGTSALHFEQSDDDLAELDRLRAYPVGVQKIVWAMICPRISSRLAFLKPTEVDEDRIALVKLAAALLGLDVEAMKATADTTIPEPKAWAKQK